MRKELAITVAGIIALAIVAGVLQGARAGPYVRGDGGIANWLDCSNSDRVEADCTPAAAAALAAGYQLKNVAIEIEGRWEDASTHGFNKGTPSTFDPECECSKDASTEGDGDGYVVLAMFNLWPGLSYEDFHFYGGGGVGYGFTEFFDERDGNFAWQAGLGTYYEITNELHVHAGARYASVFETDPGANYNSITGLVGVRWELPIW